MKVIIFDIETTMAWKRNQVQYPIEIGATKIKLNETGVKLESTFKEYIIPPITLSKRTQRFTHFKEEDMNNAIPCSEALLKFIKWIGNDYYLCSWSDADRKIIIEACVRNDILLNWFKNFNDIQVPISMHLANTRQLNLNDALIIGELNKIGHSHSAIYDALNTSMIFMKYWHICNLEMNDVNENLKYFVCKIADNCDSCNKLIYRSKGKKKRRYCFSCKMKFKEKNLISDSE